MMLSVTSQGSETMFDSVELLAEFWAALECPLHLLALLVVQSP
jgi:hypothetical protein